jgi:hypothetical protein
VISFRYLVVVVVAIFLALGLGVLAGTTVIDQSIVKTLRSHGHELRQEIDKLTTTNNLNHAFLSLAFPYLVDGRLAHKEVVLVTDDNAESDAVSEARDFLDEANATIVTELKVKHTVAPNSTARTALQQLLTDDGQPVTGSVTQDVARALANRLEIGAPQPGPTTTNPQPPDLLADLLSGGFLDFPHNSPPDPKTVGGPGQMVVVVAGGASNPAVAFEAFMVPFVEQLVQDGVPVAAAEPQDAARPFVGLLRSSPTIPDGEGLVTVDDLASDTGTTFGGVALVLGLKQLVRFGLGGDYGVKGVANVIPELP